MESYKEKEIHAIPKRQRISKYHVGFLFWTNALAVMFLLVGFAVPGWLTVTTRQIMTDHNDDVTYDLVYQDYSIWYVTQCNWAKTAPYKSSCETRSYRLLKSLKEVLAARVDVEFTGRAELYFSGFGLVFSESVVTAFQTLYTLCIAVALALLALLNSTRGSVNQGRYSATIKLKVLWVILALVSVIFTFVSVGMFLKVRGKLHQPSKEFGDNVKSSFGIVFAGIGGALMIILVIAILFCHFVDCSALFGKVPSSSDKGEEPGNENRKSDDAESQQTPM